MDWQIQKVIREIVNVEREGLVVQWKARYLPKELIPEWETLLDSYRQEETPASSEDNGQDWIEELTYYPDFLPRHFVHWTRNMRSEVNVHYVDEILSIVWTNDGSIAGANVRFRPTYLPAFAVENFLEQRDKFREEIQVQVSSTDD